MNPVSTPAIAAAFIGAVSFVALVVMAVIADTDAYLRICGPRILAGTWFGSADRRLASVPFGSLYLEWRDARRVVA